MKRKSLGLILSTLVLALTSCGFPNIFQVRLKNIRIQDTNEKTYCVGETYFDFASLTIKGTYSDNHSENFSIADVTPSLTLNGTSYNPNVAFSEAGNYTFKVQKDGVFSNALTIKVLANPVYVSSITVSGASSLVANKTTDLTVNVQPSDYTVELSATASNSKATVEKINKTTYRVKAFEVGSSDITFIALGSASTYISESHHIDITENYPTSMTVSSGSHSVARASSINITLAVTPSDFSTDVTAVSGDTSIATVDKVSNTSFRINGESIGNTTITFSTPNSQSTTLDLTYDIEVTNMQKTVIAQTYNTLVKHINGKSGCPLTGSPKLLVIPVWFTDSTSYISESNKANVREDIRKAYFGTTTETGWHSVKTFYNTESSGLLNLTGTVSEWYEPDLSSTDLRFDDEYSSETRTLVRNATNWYFNNHNDNRRNYDYDGDGYLDGVMLIYGAADYQADGVSENNLWAYCYWVQTLYPSTSNPNPNVFFWASYDFMYDYTKAMSHSGKRYNNGDCTHCNIDAHTFIHEMGHVFGLEDYYDYAQATNPCGGFSMQDYNVGGHDAFSALSMGWANPYIPTESCEITIHDFQSSRDLILLTPQWNTYNSPFDEYLLLELYTPTGLNELDSQYQYKGSPKGVNAVGIRLWHVDARLYKSGFTVNANTIGVDQALNNTSDAAVRPCRAGDAYQKYNILQLIRNNTNVTYTTTNYLQSSDLFKQGSTFDTTTFGKQFAYDLTGKLDKGIDLGWSFTVTSIVTSGSNSTATISLIKG